MRHHISRPTVDSLESRTLFAVPGDMDLDFGDRGNAVFARSFDPSQMIRLANGKLLLTERQQLLSNEWVTHDVVVQPVVPAEIRKKFDVVRLNADGSRDTSFGRFGTLDTTLDAILAAREMPGGDVLLFGQYDTDPNQAGLQPRYALIRLDKRGRQDMRFGDA